METTCLSGPEIETARSEEERVSADNDVIVKMIAESRNLAKEELLEQSMASKRAKTG
jgi:hypothetical protein